MSNPRNVSFVMAILVGLLFAAMAIGFLYEPRQIEVLPNPALDSMKVRVADVARGDLFVMWDGRIYCVYHNDGKSAFFREDGRVVGKDLTGNERTLRDHLIGGVRDVVPMSDPRYSTIIRKFVLQK